MDPAFKLCINKIRIRKKSLIKKILKWKSVLNVGMLDGSVGKIRYGNDPGMFIFEGILYVRSNLVSYSKSNESSQSCQFFNLYLAISDLANENGTYAKLTFLSEPFFGKKKDYQMKKDKNSKLNKLTHFLKI
ncbi:hypothetical protein BpHYR1_020833 [Brachionus plicatilis]|uniref:Uncharacterized protein n=1 Tax=Brachionus plicatilis TaxID=10195 RepID=A0A3M7R171_BRAPC|nr:hypothetical protein BpHYR1_020833 [Brachionus plicatilis]